MVRLDSDARSGEKQAPANLPAGVSVQWRGYGRDRFRAFDFEKREPVVRDEVERCGSRQRGVSKENATPPFGHGSVLNVRLAAPALESVNGPSILM
jgi:hypothetical protein